VVVIRLCPPPYLSRCRSMYRVERVPERSMHLKQLAEYIHTQYAAAQLNRDTSKNDGCKTTFRPALSLGRISHQISAAPSIREEFKNICYIIFHPGHPRATAEVQRCFRARSIESGQKVSQPRGIAKVLQTNQGEHIMNDRNRDSHTVIDRP